MILLFATLAMAGAVKATLISSSDRARPGETITVGVRYEIEPGWHIYWENPGDSGIATEVMPRLPEGWTHGQVQFPGPRPFVLPGQIVNYGYEHETVLRFDVQAPQNAYPGTTVEIDVHTRWLECTADRCVPGEASLSTPLEITRRRASREPVGSPESFPVPASSYDVRAHRTDTGVEVVVPGRREVFLVPDRDLEAGLRRIEYTRGPRPQSRRYEVHLELTLDRSALGPDPGGVLITRREGRIFCCGWIDPPVRYVTLELPSESP